MTPAARLRMAAEKLRELSAAATPGPWEAEDPSWSRFFHNGSRSLGTTYPDEDNLTGIQHGNDAAYIAAMGPPVGAAMAGLLEWASLFDRDLAKYPTLDRKVFAIVDAILGADPEAVEVVAIADKIFGQKDEG